MPRQGSLTLFPREAEDFSMAGNDFGDMPLLTYLAWLQPICYNPKLVFIYVNTAKVLLVVKTLIKQHKKTATLISNHESKIKIIPPSKNTFQNMGELQNCSPQKNAFQNYCL